MVAKDKYFSHPRKERPFHLTYLYTSLTYKTGIALLVLGVALLFTDTVYLFIPNPFTFGNMVQSSLTMIQIGTILILTYAVGASQERAHEQQHAIQMFPHRLAVLNEFEKHIEAAREAFWKVRIADDVAVALNQVGYEDLIDNVERAPFGGLSDYWPALFFDCSKTQNKIARLRLSLNELLREKPVDRVKVGDVLEEVVSEARQLHSTLRRDLFASISG